MANGKNILEIKGLRVAFHTDDGTVHALNDVDLELGDGETLGLVGETGAGKTTLAKSIMRLIPSPPGRIEAGEIFFEGRDIVAADISEMLAIRGDRISMIFQDPMSALNPVITVGDQIAEVIKVHQKVSQREADERALAMLATVGITADRAGDYPHQFSGGMKLRVVIAIALACNPKLLIADEPTTALDVTIQAQVLELMKELRRRFNTSMIMITHDLGIVAEICDRVAVMYAGNVVERGTTEEVFENPLHPYTRALFDAVPDIEDEKHELKVISGAAHNPTKLPAGCPFHPRCPVVRDVCKSVEPKDVEAASEHAVRCFLYDAEASN